MAVSPIASSSSATLLTQLLRSLLRPVVLACVALLLLLPQACNNEVLPGPSIPPPSAFSVAQGGTVTIPLNNISVPGGLAAFNATLEQGSGTLAVINQPTTGATGGSATLEYTAPNQAETARITITITDQQKEAQTATRTILVVVPEIVVLDAPTLSANTTTASILTGEEATFVFAVASPGGLAGLQATASNGSAVLVAEPTAGSTSGSATVRYTNNGTAGAATITVTAVDQQATPLSGEITFTVAVAPPSFTLTEMDFNGATLSALEGSINGELTLTSDKEYLLVGAVLVGTGGVLTIEAGTTLYGKVDDANGAYLAVQQGGMLMALGQAGSPVVFTSSNTLPGAVNAAAAGDWGGLVVNGNAQVNLGESGQGLGDTGPYGQVPASANNEDNSGTLTYVRVAYGGQALDGSNPLSGIGLYGVGSRSTVHHIQAFNALGDGISLLGGTVNVKQAIATGAGDDAFNIREGWSGNGQFWIAENTSSGDRLFEVENNRNDTDASPFTNPVVTNVLALSNGSNDALRLWEGTKGVFHNLLIYQPNAGISALELSGSQTLTNRDNFELLLTNSIIYYPGQDTTEAYREAALFLETSSLENQLLDYTALPTDWAVTVSSGAVNPADVYGAGFFSSISYIGALDSGDDWASNWALNADGTAR